MVQRFFIPVLLFFVALAAQVNESKAQSCVIISKGNFMDPATLCAPVDVEWDILYTGVQDGGSSVQIFIDWDDGNTDLLNAVETNAATSEWSVTNAPHTYPAGGSQCRYEPTAFLVVNGNQCTSTAQQQVVTVWDTDDENGGDIAIAPQEFRVCIGHSATVSFTDISNFNCVPPEENDNPNNGGRWVQWEYGTGNAANRIPGIEVGGSPQAYPFAGAVDNRPAPVLAPWSTSQGIFVPSTTTIADIGREFEVTLNNWNQCNPYPSEPPVIETARIVLVAAPIPNFISKKLDNSGITTTIFCQGEQVYFRNQTSWPSGSARGYQWTFYDGPTSADPVHSTSGSRHPTRTFNSPGFKLVRMVATDGNVSGNCDEVIEKTIEVIAGPVAQIQINTEPLTTDTLTFCEDQFGVNQVIFTDQSLNVTVNTIHTWEFFDGSGNLVRTEGPSVPGTVLGPFNETYAAPGVYDVVLQVQDKNTDCASFDTAVVVITALPQAIFNISSGGTVCNNNTVTFDESSLNFTTVPSGFVNDTISTWSWWFEYDGNPLGAPDLVINSGVSGDTSHVYPTPGNFAVRLLVESANGCIGESIQNFLVNPEPIATFGIANQVGCAPLISDLINTSIMQPAGVVIDKYTWTIYDPTGVVLDIVDQPTLDTLQYTFFNSSPEFDAKYAITLTAIDQSGCAFVSPPDTVLVYPSPIISFTSDDYNPFDDNCAPLSATFDVDSIFHANNNVLNYHWTVDDGEGNVVTTTVSGVQDSFLYNNFINTGVNVKIYTITLTADLNTGGCVVPFTQPVIAQPVPNSAFTAIPEENCEFIQFQMETIQKAGILFYDWEFSEVPSNNPLLDDSFELTFERPDADSVDITVDVSLVVTNTSNCISDTTRAQIFIPRKPTVNVDLLNTGPVAGCSPFVASFRNNTATYPPGTVFEFWVTYGANDPIQDVPTSGNLLGNFTYQFTAIGDYRVQLKAIEPTNSCPYIDEELITVYPEAEARFFTPTSGDCAPWDAIFFDDSNDTTIVRRIWNVIGPGVNFTEEFATKTNFTYTFLNNTVNPIDYDVTYTVENIYGCRNAKAETVTAFPQLQPSFTVTPKTQTLPSSTITIVDTTPVNPWDYRWDFGDGTFSTDPNTSTHTYSTFGVFPISLEVTDPTTGCIGIAYDTVEVIAIPPIVDFEYDTPNGCAPVTVNFTNLSQYASPGTYQWDFGDGIGTSRQQNPTYTYYDPGTYTVTLSASNELDSVVTERKEFIIQVYAEAVANFSVRPEEVFLPDESIRLVNRSEGADSYLWDFGDGNGSTEFEPIHKYEKAGNYDVSLIVTSVNGCTDSLTIEKAVFANDGGKFLIPNTFTPNGDGQNDTFKPEIVGVVDFYMEIYDRWGELLYVTDQVSDPGWDGSFNGKPVTQDVYVYKVKMKFISGKNTVKTGDVTLLR